MNQQLSQRRVKRRRKLPEKDSELESSTPEQSDNENDNEPQSEVDNTVEEVADDPIDCDVKGFLLNVGPSATLGTELDVSDIEIQSSQNAGELAEVLHRLLREAQTLNAISNTYQGSIGKALLLLLESFRQDVNKTKGQQSEEFLAYIKSNFKIGRTSFYNYKKYYLFLCDYPRFRYVPIVFSEFCPWISKIREWFKQDLTGQPLHATPLYWSCDIGEQEHSDERYYIETD